jgi:FtsZ-binding cell division protein ZapB
MRHTSFEEVLMEKSAWKRYETRAEELLSAMGNQEVKPDTGDQEAKPEKKRFYKILLQNILVTCCGILAIAAAGKGFLYLDNGISTVESAVGSAVKDLNAFKAEVAAANTKEEITTATAEIEDLKTTNTQLRAEVEQLREAFETSKARNNNVVSMQRKRR